MSIRTTCYIGATMIEVELIEELKNNIGKILPVPGLQVEISPAKKEEPWSPEYIASISIDGHGFEAVVEVVPSRSSAIFRSKLVSLVSYTGRDEDVAPLILSDYFSEEKREECKKAGMNFIDISGNAYIAH
jgi:hypothetical protein